ncbi:MAG: WecB/TagA/CpsF family glycosyltransferase [Desulfobacterium sp.]|nr:WecB/TagA/CpsF family glycosyltransferase [Desulfobacterium sp.]MBU3946668.1 WecB/TagA/CpsF family glycosyltransferase [Pseudomonadota bacterium]MBU4035214.1 WecB/TagA/CpsF family glycosyltransferase [Pseudomonadota bacterium]
MNERLKVLDIWVDPLDRGMARSRVLSFLETGKRPHAIFASNPEKIFSVPKDPELLLAFKNADILLPDGIGMVLAARILHGCRFPRIPGSEFIFDICDIAARKGYGIFVYGAKEEVNSASVDNIRKRYPNLRIAGRANGYVSETDMPALVERINESKADILFIALGSPKQEKWFARYKDSLKYVRVCQGIGGTLDTIAGTVKRAPAIWCNLGLEWLYRLLSDPSRIKRQRLLPVFALKIILARIGWKKQ